MIYITLNTEVNVIILNILDHMLHSETNLKFLKLCQSFC